MEEQKTVHLTKIEYQISLKNARHEGYNAGYDEGYQDGLSEHEEGS